MGYVPSVRRQIKRRSETVDKMWRCGVCGYIHEGEEAPDKCPKCGAPKEKFAEIAEADVEKISGAVYTNSLHMTLHALLEDVIDLAYAGIEDDLDPGCVDLFEKAVLRSSELQQMIKAELAVHVDKGKWG